MMIVVLFPVLQDDGRSLIEFRGCAWFRFLFPLSLAFQDINAYNGDEPKETLPFPIIDDKNRDLAILLGMLDPAEKDEKGMPVTARVVSCRNPLCRNPAIMTGQALCPSKCLDQLEEKGEYLQLGNNYIGGNLIDYLNYDAKSNFHPNF